MINLWLWLVFLVLAIGGPLAGIVLLVRARGRDSAALAAMARSPFAKAAPGVFGGVLFLFGTYFLVGQGGSFLVHLFSNLPMTCMFIGLGLLSAVMVRIGTEHRCARCGYERSPEMQREPGADLCPECAEDWTRPGGTVVGRPRISRTLLIAGLLLVGFPVLYLLVGIGRPGVLATRITRYLPTDSLITEVTSAPRGFTIDEWAVLSKRTLDPRQEQRLATGLMDLRLRRGHINPTAQLWLDALASSGNMDPGLRERYFRETLELRLEHEPAGEGMMNLRPRAREWRGTTSNGAAYADYIAFGGFQVGDDPSPRGRLDTWRRGVNFAPTSPTGPLPTFHGSEGVRVRATCWVIIGSASPPDAAIEWKSDGTPVIPDWAEWYERIDLEWPEPPEAGGRR